MKFLKVMEQNLTFLLSFLSLASFVILWYIIAAVHLFGELLPSPARVAAQFYSMLLTPVGEISFIMHIYYSLKRVLIAFGAAAIIGIPLGLIMGWYKKVDAIVKPIYEVIRPIPPIAWVPLAILWFGIGEAPKVFIVFVGALVPCLLNSYTGIKLTDPILIDAARTFGANDRQLFWEVAVPSSLPAVFAGLQNGLSLGWMCVLAAELVAAREGVGYLITLGMESANPAMILVGMVTIGGVGAIIAVGLRYLERKLCPWRRGRTA